MTQGESRRIANPEGLGVIMLKSIVELEVNLGDFCGVGFFNAEFNFLLFERLKLLALLEGLLGIIELEIDTVFF